MTDITPTSGTVLVMLPSDARLSNGLPTEVQWKTADKESKARVRWSPISDCGPADAVAYAVAIRLAGELAGGRVPRPGSLTHRNGRMFAHDPDFNDEYLREYFETGGIVVRTD